MKSNKVILFDWGGVIELPVDTPNVYSYHQMHAEALRSLFPQLDNRADEDLFNTVYGDAWWLVANTSLTVMEDYFTERLVAAGLGNQSTAMYLDKVISYSHKVHFAQDVVNYLYELNNRCTAGILSDLALIDVPRIKAQIKPSLVDKYFLSCEIGASKWDRKVFEHVSKEVGAKPYDILFFDDKVRNVEQAKAHGWNAFQATAFDLDYIKEVCEDFLEEECYE